VLGRILVRYLRPAWPLIVAVVVFQLAQSIASLLLPTLNAEIIDEGVVVGNIPLIWSTGGVMLVVSLVQVVCAIVAVYFGSKLAMGMGRDLRSDLFHRVVAFSQREVGQFGPPSLITRNTNDVQQVQMLVQVSATLMISAPMLAIGGVIMAVRQDAGLSWLMAVAIPVLLVIVGLIVWRMVPAFSLMQQRIDRVNQIIREQLTGIRVVRAFVREREERARFTTASNEVKDTALRAGNLMAIMFPAVMLVMNVSSVAVIWFGGFEVQNSGVEIGTLFAFLTYLMQILMGVMMATFMFVMIPRAAVCANRIGEVLDTDPSVAAPAVASAAPSPTRAPKRACCTRSPSRSSPARRPPSSDQPAPEKRHSSAWWLACSTSPPALCASMGSMCVSTIPTNCGDVSVSCSSAPSCSLARSPTIFGTDGPKPPTKNSGGRSTSRRGATSSKRSATGSRHRSRRVAPTCRAASVSASRSHERW
jgi:ABC-type multidrug transport system fused ATPase/permease subunit